MADTDNITPSKTYRLRAPDGKFYESPVKGDLGGYAPERIYGRLDCPSAKRHLEKGKYANHRVFFADKATAIASGFRPCFYCMREEYKRWKAGGEPGTPEYPWLITP